jgi:ribonucleotide reductase beta subunit family protein with ferritin-like domain
MKQANIKVWRDGYIDNYPEFSKLADEQIKIFWPWNEITVSKDKQDLLVGMTEAEKHGTISTLKLFTKYELFVGNEHWGSRIAKAYPQVGVQRMAAAFAHVELNSHAPFYNEINRELGLATYGFYTEYLNDPVLSARMKFIDEVINDSDDELSTAVFSLVEGAILYSSFAFLKHFQSQGKNKLQSVVRGINMSARDENLHAIGGAGLVKVALAEQERSDYEMRQFVEAVLEAADQLRKHEHEINAKIFEHGNIDGISLFQMDNFSDSRINLCLQQLGINPAYKVDYNPIAEYFYKGINDFQMNDFFQGVGREYQRDWVKERFIWVKG